MFNEYKFNLNYYENVPLIHEYTNKGYFREYDYIPNTYSEFLEELREIIIKENISKIKSFAKKITFSKIKETEINDFDFNLEKILEKILISFARQKALESKKDYYFSEELDPFIIGQFCIQNKISFNTYLKYSKLIKKVFMLYIEKNYIFDDWGFYSISYDKELIEIHFREAYLNKRTKKTEIYIEKMKNMENIIEEVDF